jgi:low temperature requirement protein LtrA
MVFEPPRLRTIETGDDDRRATWLELFFDLVFVAAVGQLASNLAGDHTLTGLLDFLALFVPVWWAWMGFTFYANRFDTDDLTYRLLILAAMFAVAVLATAVHDAFHGGSAGFALAYVAVRLALIALYARAWRYVDEGRRLARLFFCSFSGAVALWLASLAVPEPWRYLLWIAALAVELGTPLFAWRLIPRAPIDPRHLPERFGLLIMIVLGESVLAVVLGVANVSWTLGSALTATGGFAIAAALWWIYFDFLDEASVRRGLLGGLVFTYSNFFIVAGLTALGAGVKLAILDAGGDPHYADTTWIVCGGLAICMLGIVAVQLVTPPAAFDTDVWLRLGTLVLALALLPLSFVLPAIALVWILAAALAAQVVVEIRGHGAHGHAEGPI